MPSVSSRQRKFFGAELGRKRAGEKTETKMSTEQLRDFARKTPSSKEVTESYRHDRSHKRGKHRATKRR